MNSQQRKEEYLAKAKEADDHAEKAKDSLAKETWRTIAQGYRDLAKRQ